MRFYTGRRNVTNKKGLFYSKFFEFEEFLIEPFFCSSIQPQHAVAYCSLRVSDTNKEKIMIVFIMFSIQDKLRLENRLRKVCFQIHSSFLTVNSKLCYTFVNTSLHTLSKYFGNFTVVCV